MGKKANCNPENGMQTAGTLTADQEGIRHMVSSNVPKTRRENPATAHNATDGEKRSQTAFPRKIIMKNDTP